MDVNVDEAGTDGEAGGIELASAIRTEIAADCDDPMPFAEEIGAHRPRGQCKHTIPNQQTPVGRHSNSLTGPGEAPSVAGNMATAAFIPWRRDDEISAAAASTALFVAVYRNGVCGPIVPGGVFAAAASGRGPA